MNDLKCFIVMRGNMAMSAHMTREGASEECDKFNYGLLFKPCAEVKEVTLHKPKNTYFVWEEKL